MKNLTFLTNKMKWLLVPLVLLTLSIGNAWGADLKFNSFSGLGSSSYSSGSTTSSPITLASTGWYGASATELRIKSGAKVTISCTSSYKITNIVFTAKETKYAKLQSPVKWSGTTGTYTNDLGTTSVTFSNSAQCRFSSIVVTYTADCTGLEMSTVTAAPGNGSISLSWSAVTNADSYTVTCKKKSDDSTTGIVIGGVSGSSTKTCEISGLTNGTEYTWSVMPVGSGDYCDSNTPATGDATPNVYYTVTWNNNGSQYTTTSVASGSRPVFPDAPSSCDGTSTTFYGWTASPWSGKLDDVSAKTIYTSGSAMPNVSGPVTYHAVFAKGTANTYKKGTKADLTDGQTVLIVNPSASVALKGDKSAQSVTITSNKITTESKAVLWTVEPHGSGYYFKYGSNYLNAGTSSIYVDNDADEWSVSESGPYILTSGNQSSKSLQYYNSSWKIYNTGNNSYFQMDFYIPDYSQYLTTCCTELGSINGSFS